FRALGAVAVRRGVVGGPVGIYELALRTRLHRGLDLGHEALQAVVRAPLGTRAVVQVVVGADDLGGGHDDRACLHALEDRLRRERALGTEAFLAQRQHVAAR